MAVLGPLLLGDGAAGGAGAAATWPRWRCCWRWARGADPDDRDGFTRFYMRVWKLFFLEYALVALACLAG